MRKKHYIITVLVLVIVFAIAGCSNQAPAASDAEINIEQVNSFLNESAGLGSDGMSSKHAPHDACSSQNRACSVTAHGSS